MFESDDSGDDLSFLSFDNKLDSQFKRKEDVPLKIWAEHFIKPEKERNVSLTKIFEREFILLKGMYCFLDETQIMGKTLKKLGIPNICGRVNKKFLQSAINYKKKVARFERRNKNYLTKPNCQSNKRANKKQRLDCKDFTLRYLPVAERWSDIAKRKFKINSNEYPSKEMYIFNDNKQPEESSCKIKYGNYFKQQKYVTGTQNNTENNQNNINNTKAITSMPDINGIKLTSEQYTNQITEENNAVITSESWSTTAVINAPIEKLSLQKPLIRDCRFVKNVYHKKSVRFNDNDLCTFAPSQHFEESSKKEESNKNNMLFLDTTKETSNTIKVDNRTVDNPSSFDLAKVSSKINLLTVSPHLTGESPDTIEENLTIRCQAKDKLTLNFEIEPYEKNVIVIEESSDINSSSSDTVKKDTNKENKLNSLLDNQSNHDLTGKEVVLEKSQSEQTNEVIANTLDIIDSKKENLPSIDKNIILTNENNLERVVVEVTPLSYINSSSSEANKKDIIKEKEKNRSIFPQSIHDFTKDNDSLNTKPLKQTIEKFTNMDNDFNINVNLNLMSPNEIIINSNSLETYDNTVIDETSSSHISSSISDTNRKDVNEEINQNNLLVHKPILDCTENYISVNSGKLKQTNKELADLIKITNNKKDNNLVSCNQTKTDVNCLEKYGNVVIDESPSNSEETIDKELISPNKTRKVNKSPQVISSTLNKVLFSNFTTEEFSEEEYFPTSLSQESVNCISEIKSTTNEGNTAVDIFKHKGKTDIFPTEGSSKPSLEYLEVMSPLSDRDYLSDNSEYGGNEECDNGTSSKTKEKYLKELPRNYELNEISELLEQSCNNVQDTYDDKCPDIMCKDDSGNQTNNELHLTINKQGGYYLDECNTKEIFNKSCTLVNNTNQNYKNYHTKITTKLQSTPQELQENPSDGKNVISAPFKSIINPFEQLEPNRYHFDKESFQHSSLKENKIRRTLFPSQNENMLQNIASKNINEVEKQNLYLSAQSFKILSKQNKNYFDNRETTSKIDQKSPNVSIICNNSCDTQYSESSNNKSLPMSNLSTLDVKLPLSEKLSKEKKSSEYQPLLSSAISDCSNKVDNLNTIVNSQNTSSEIEEEAEISLNIISNKKQNKSKDSHELQFTSFNVTESLTKNINNISDDFSPLSQNESGEKSLGNISNTKHIEHTDLRNESHVFKINSSQPKFTDNLRSYISNEQHRKYTQSKEEIISKIGQATSQQKKVLIQNKNETVPKITFYKNEDHQQVNTLSVNISNSKIIQNDLNETTQSICAVSDKIYTHNEKVKTIIVDSTKLNQSESVSQLKVNTPPKVGKYEELKSTEKVNDENGVDKILITSKDFKSRYDQQENNFNLPNSKKFSFKRSEVELQSQEDMFHQNKEFLLLTTIPINVKSTNNTNELNLISDINSVETNKCYGQNFKSASTNDSTRESQPNSNLSVEDTSSLVTGNNSSNSITIGKNKISDFKMKSDQSIENESYNINALKWSTEGKPISLINSNNSHSNFVKMTTVDHIKNKLCQKPSKTVQTNSPCKIKNTLMCSATKIQTATTTKQHILANKYNISESQNSTNYDVTSLSEPETSIKNIVTKDHPSITDKRNNHELMNVFKKHENTQSKLRSIQSNKKQFKLSSLSPLHYSPHKMHNKQGKIHSHTDIRNKSKKPSSQLSYTDTSGVNFSRELPIHNFNVEHPTEHQAILTLDKQVVNYKAKKQNITLKSHDKIQHHSKNGDKVCCEGLLKIYNEKPEQIKSEIHKNIVTSMSNYKIGKTDLLCSSQTTVFKPVELSKNTEKLPVYSKTKDMNLVRNLSPKFFTTNTTYKVGKVNGKVRSNNAFNNSFTSQTNTIEKENIKPSKSFTNYATTAKVGVLTQNIPTKKAAFLFSGREEKSQKRQLQKNNSDDLSYQKTQLDKNYNPSYSLKYKLLNEKSPVKVISYGPNTGLQTGYPNLFLQTTENSLTDGYKSFQSEHFYEPCSPSISEDNSFNLSSSDNESNSYKNNILLSSNKSDFNNVDRNNFETLENNKYSSRNRKRVFSCNLDNKTPETEHKEHTNKRMREALPIFSSFGVRKNLEDNYSVRDSDSSDKETSEKGSYKSDINNEFNYKLPQSNDTLRESNNYDYIKNLRECLSDNTSTLKTDSAFPSLSDGYSLNSPASQENKNDYYLADMFECSDGSSLRSWSAIGSEKDDNSDF